MILAQLDLLNASPLVFPVLEVVHILGFALSIGTIAIVDFRLLGLGMRRQAPAEISRDLSIITIIGLGMVILSGSLLFLSDPDNYYLNRAFQIKMGVLLAAILYHYTVHERLARKASPGAGRIAACVSLVLWFSVIAGGIFIGFA